MTLNSSGESKVTEFYILQVESVGNGNSSLILITLLNCCHHNPSVVGGGVVVVAR